LPVYFIHGVYTDNRTMFEDSFRQPGEKLKDRMNSQNQQ